MPTLLNPWMIGLGTSALALPMVIHWLTRPRPLAWPLSTMRFVRQIVQQRRTTSRLRDILILLIRALAIALLAYAFARPFLGVTPLVAGGESGAAARIVVLDESLSMSAVSHGITPFERGRQRASDILAYQTGLQANLLFAGPRPRPVFDRLTTNLSALRKALAQATPQPYALNIQQTINRAADMLSKTDPKVRRELVIISDFQRTNWANVDFSPLPKDTLIQLESVAPAQTAPNLAITKISVQGRAEQGQPIKVEITVGNYTPESRKVHVELTLADSVFQGEALCPKGIQTIIAVDVKMPHEPGWFSGQARLVDADDALPADNIRPFVLNVRSAPVFALITREPATPQPNSSYFMERALAPVIARDNTADAPRVMRIAPDSIDAMTLAKANMIVIDHPGKLSAPALALLASELRRGTPIFYLVAEPLDATNLKLMGDSAGTDWKLPVDFVPPTDGIFRRDLFILEAKRDQPPFQIFADDLPGVLAPLRFSGGLSTVHREGGLTDDILATYSDHSAALIITSCGAGKLALLNADLSISNLPANPAFVPLIGELVNRLMSAHRDTSGITAGDPFAVYLPTAAGPAAGLTITIPKSQIIPGVLSEENGFVLWRSSQPLPPGIYEITRDNKCVFALAAAIPETEADLAPIDLELLKTRLAAGRQIDVHVANGDDDSARRDNTWAWLLAACAICVTLELFVLRSFKT